VFDHHVHTTYSDGFLPEAMVEAAVEAGLDGVGLADHCTVSERASARRYRRRLGFNLDVTHERRRATIADLREEFEIEIADAVEMDYHPDDEAAIREFLDATAFDYALGSVHEVDGTNVHRDHFAGLSAPDRRAAVETYFDRLVALVDSGLFDVVAHVDVFERNPALRGLATTADYERVADALAGREVVVEVNAGRVDQEYGRLHPAPAFRAVLADAGVTFVPSTDAHGPAELTARVPELRAAVDGDADRRTA
jgi:histidinol-phosphatase (PHP family)